VQTFLRSISKDEIVSVADEKDVDTLVVGSRDMGMIRRTLFGSTSDTCVHKCHCPVLVYKPNQH